MTKKKAQSANPERKMQRETLDALRQELSDLHQISLAVLSDRGILPPLYGGEHLDEDREIIPLWGGDDDPELGALLMRVVPGIEPDADLEDMRDEMGLSNDWPISELLDTLKTPAGKSLVEGAEEISDLSMLFVLLDSQIRPAPGYDRETMLDWIADMRPYAVFPVIPVSGEDDNLVYHWDELEKFRAEVVYAETPELLEAAVWEYRLNLALQSEIDEIKAEGLDPDDELLASDMAGLSALFELVVLRGLRLYGVTSPVRSRQAELDILREENDDLIVRAPLKPEIEPVPLLAEDRRHIEGNHSGLIVHLRNPALQKIWPQVRAHKVYCVRLHHGVYRRGRGDRLNISGYSATAKVAWFAAETLGDLYRQVRLGATYEMLAAVQLIENALPDRQPTALTDSASTTPGAIRL
jgi:hypothetical protein